MTYEDYCKLIDRIFKNLEYRVYDSRESYYSEYPFLLKDKVKEILVDIENRLVSGADVNDVINYIRFSRMYR
jgi:hypothetical protein